MKKFFYLFVTILALNMPNYLSATEEISGDSDRREIVIINHKPIEAPHAMDIDDPIAHYTVSTATLSIELDPVYYSQYTIIIQSDYASLDYIVTSPVVNIPVGSLDSVVDIYIESDDCGCYYGTLNQAAYGNTF